jgi:hypothetical protein
VASSEYSGLTATPATPALATPATIAEQVGVLDNVSDLPLAEHAEVYQRLHTQLQAALAEIDGP